MSGISKSQVGRLCEEIDASEPSSIAPSRAAGPSLDRRDLRESSSERPIVSVDVIVAVGVAREGRREVLGLDIGSSEAEWTGFLRKLAHGGVQATVSKVLNASRQLHRVMGHDLD